MTPVKGYLRLRHRRGQNPCNAPDLSDPQAARKCNCAPSVYARFGKNDEHLIGHLSRGWVKADLEPFEEKLRDLRSIRLTGRAITHRTFGEHFESWLNDLYDTIVAEGEDASISELTYNAYEQRWRLHLEKDFGHLAPEAITPKLLRAFLTRKVQEGMSQNYANNLLTPMSACFSDMDGNIPNPCTKPKRGRHGLGKRNTLYFDVNRDDESTRKHLEIVEVIALLDAARPKARSMIRAYLVTGCRRSELLAWRWEDINWIDGYITVQGQIGQRRQHRNRVKGGFFGRRVPLAKSVLADLGKRRQAEGYVWTPDDGDVFSQNGALKVISVAFKDAGIAAPGGCFRCLRHTANSNMKANAVRYGIGPESIEIVMGHKRPGTNAIYTHLLDEQFKLIAQCQEDTFGDDALVPRPTSAAPSVPRPVQDSGVTTGVGADSPKVRRKRF